MEEDYQDCGRNDAISRLEFVAGHLNRHGEDYDILMSVIANLKRDNVVSDWADESVKEDN